MDSSLFKKGLDSYPLTSVTLNNLLLLLWITIGTVASYIFNPVAGIIYFLFFLITFILLKKLVCANCFYYGKWCSMGWGKLSALLFKKGKVEDFAGSPGMRIAPIVYGFLTLIPIILIIVSMIFKYEFRKIVVLFLFLLLSFYTNFFNRKKACANCKMNMLCPGSLVKR